MRINIVICLHEDGANVGGTHALGEMHCQKLAHNHIKKSHKNLASKVYLTVHVTHLFSGHVCQLWITFSFCNITVHNHARISICYQ